MSSRAALARHPVAIAGAVIATVAAVVFIALAIAVVVGLLDNPYAGLVVFIVVPALFVLGLLLDAAGDVAAAAKTAAAIPRRSPSGRSSTSASHASAASPWRSSR